MGETRYHGRLDNLQPDVPDDYPDDAIPFGLAREDAEIVYDAVDDVDLSDVGKNLKAHLWSIMAGQINRYALFKYEGVNFTIGWVWVDDDGEFQIRLRHEVLQCYDTDKWVTGMKDVGLFPATDQ